MRVLLEECRQNLINITAWFQDTSSGILSVALELSGFFYEVMR